MSWFKKAKNFNDRNVINAKIRYLKDVREQVKSIGSLVFQSAKIAKDVNYRIITSDKITSYPSLHNTLVEADAVALDNPWRFSGICESALEQIDRLISSLLIERKDFIRSTDKFKYQKGWI